MIPRLPEVIYFISWIGVIVLLLAVIVAISIMIAYVLLTTSQKSRNPYLKKHKLSNGKIICTVFTTVCFISTWLLGVIVMKWTRHSTEVAFSFFNTLLGVTIFISKIIIERKHCQHPAAMFPTCCSKSNTATISEVCDQFYKYIFLICSIRWSQSLFGLLLFPQKNASE